MVKCKIDAYPRKERARVLIQHDKWLYVRDERGREGFVPLNVCHTETSVSIEVGHIATLFLVGSENFGVDFPSFKKGLENIVTAFNFYAEIFLH